MSDQNLWFYFDIIFVLMTFKKSIKKHVKYFSTYDFWN